MLLLFSCLLGAVLGRLGGPLGPSGGLPRRLGASRPARNESDEQEQTQSHGTQIQQNRNLLHVGRKPVPCNKPVYETKMKQKRHLLHFQASNLLHVRKTHNTIHVTNRCMKQKMKQNRNLLHRSNSRTHVFFLGAPWHSATVFKSASVRGLRGGSRDMARRGLWGALRSGARVADRG